MKTTTNLMKTGKKLLYALLFMVGLGLSNYSNACTANFTYTTGVNGQVTFTSTSTGVSANTQYFWDANDGSGLVGTGYTTSYHHQYIANGTYNVLLWIYDSLGSCNDSIRLAVNITNVTNPCNMHASFTYATGGHGQATFTSTSTNTNANTLYYWNYGDGTPTTQWYDTATHKYTYNGYYDVWLTIRDTGSGFCTDSVDTWVYISNADSNNCSLLHPYFTYTTGANGQVTLTSTSLGPISDYTWNRGNATPDTDTYWNNTVSYYYTANGTYNVTLYITGDSNNSCTDSITLPVTVSNVSSHPCNMVTSFSRVNDSNGLVHFFSTTTDTIYGNTQYSWDPGDGSGVVNGTSHFSHTFPFIGYYIITLTTTDTGAYACQNTYMDTLYIGNRDSLQANFYYVGDSSHAGQYDFYSTSLGVNNDTYYKWDAGDGSPADSGLGMTTYTHIYSHNGPYNATLTIWYTQIPHAPNRTMMVHYSESSKTETVNVSTATGIANISNDGGEFTLYPNPSNGEFSLAFGNIQSQQAELEITNILGEQVYKATVEVAGNKPVQDINMQNVPSGVYFVRLITNTQVYTSKLVIRK